LEWQVVDSETGTSVVRGEGGGGRGEGERERERMAVKILMIDYWYY
jgi:hypothetical protein